MQRERLTDVPSDACISESRSLLWHAPHFKGRPCLTRVGQQSNAFDVYNSFFFFLRGEGYAFLPPACRVLHAAAHQWPQAGRAAERWLQRPRKSPTLRGDIAVPETTGTEVEGRTLPSDARLV